MQKHIKIAVIAAVTCTGLLTGCGKGAAKNTKPAGKTETTVDTKNIPKAQSINQSKPVTENSNTNPSLIDSSKNKNSQASGEAMTFTDPKNKNNNVEHLQKLIDNIRLGNKNPEDYKDLVYAPKALAPEKLVQLLATNPAAIEIQKLGQYYTIRQETMETYIVEDGSKTLRFIFSDKNQYNNPGFTIDGISAD